MKILFLAFVFLIITVSAKAEVLKGSVKQFEGYSAFETATGEIQKIEIPAFLNPNKLLGLEAKMTLIGEAHPVICTDMSDACGPTKGEPKVSYNPWNLVPLQRLVDSGKLKADAENPLLLWIDIKDIRTKIIVKFARILEKYPMVGKEVTIILTGTKGFKRKFVEDYPHINVDLDEGSLGYS